MSSKKLKGNQFWSQKDDILNLKLELLIPDPQNTELYLKGVKQTCKVSKVKVRLEQELGILPEMYYLSYLDSIPMEDSSRLSDHDVVNRGTLRINVWRMWQELLKAALAGNIKDCFACSLNISGKSEWSKYCAWVTLYVASHHGHHNLVSELFKRTSLVVNFTSSCGWTALHAAARMGRWKVLCMLIDNGVDVRITDHKDVTAHDLSHKYAHKRCENSLAFCEWNLQKHRIVQERKLDYDAIRDRQLASRLAHQLVDSTQNHSFRGTHGQRYLVHIQNPVTVATVKKFQEERVSNPFAKENVQEKIEEDLKCRDSYGKINFNYGWFDELRAQQLIPSSRDIIRFSDPSSCQLRPRSLLNPGGYKLNVYTPPPALIKKAPTISATLPACPRRTHHSLQSPLKKVGGAAALRTLDLEDRTRGVFS